MGQGKIPQSAACGPERSPDVARAQPGLACNFLEAAGTIQDRPNDSLLLRGKQRALLRDPRRPSFELRPAGLRARGNGRLVESGDGAVSPSPLRARPIGQHVPGDAVKEGVHVAHVVGCPRGVPPPETVHDGSKEDFLNEILGVCRLESAPHVRPDPGRHARPDPGGFRRRVRFVHPPTLGAERDRVTGPRRHRPDRGEAPTGSLGLAVPPRSRAVRDRARLPASHE